ncbi:transcription factor HBP-1b(c38)-like [Lolium rigidum]|uniref:transcription factor HBP-1b(c38)-like n=1 Tax=Lolium rigidum TaxID=89674 RepID=UPI001F5D605C|nr:transcription factor HBP-1b(c38)-like [Lolium rigidum]
MPMPSAAAPMGIYDRRHHHPLADATAAVWAEPFRYMASGSASGSGAPHGVELAEPKFEPHPMAPHDVHDLALPPSPDSSDDQEPARPGHKKERRLAQNREAARKSRLRKKAYIQNLETSKMKLARMEQEIRRVRQQQQQALYAAGASTSTTSHPGLPLPSSFDPVVAAFEIEHARWVEEQTRQTRELRAALQQQHPEATEPRLRALAEAGLAHYDRMFLAKAAAARRDVFFVMSGAWRPAAERFFLWIAGFRPSDLLKVLAPQLGPLAERQQAAVGALRQTARQAEDALSQGLDKLQQSLADSLLLSATDQEDDGFDDGAGAGSYSYVARRMGGAMRRLEELAGFVEQADHLRQETLRNMYRILTPRQAAVGLLALGDYSQRLHALSTLWAARPREPV